MTAGLVNGFVKAREGGRQGRTAWLPDTRRIGRGAFRVGRLAGKQAAGVHARMLLMRVPEFPSVPTGSHPVIYVSTDSDAENDGCSWGLLVAHLDGNFWVLTSIGIRYYGIEAEHIFLHRNDPGWGDVDTCWRAGLRHVADMQRTTL